MDDNYKTYYNLCIVKRDKDGTTIEVLDNMDFTSIKKLKKEIAKKLKEGTPYKKMDVRVFSGEKDDEHAYYRGTLDSITLEELEY